MTTIETSNLSPETEKIHHDSQEPLPRVVADRDIAFVVGGGNDEMAVGDDAVVGLTPGKRVEVNQRTQYQILWGKGLEVTIEPQSV